MATHEEWIAEIRSGARGEADFSRLLRCKGPENGRGYDLRILRAGRRERKVEVRTRVIGTDNGERGPRITLTDLKMRTADFLAWAHYSRDGKLIRAWLIPISSIVGLYAKHRLSNGHAHLPWKALTTCRGAGDVTASNGISSVLT